MNEEYDKNTNTVEGGIYEIRLEGILGEQWQGWFEGFTITEKANETCLKGEITDQSALHGLLRRIRDVGLPLVFIQRLDRSEDLQKSTQNEDRQQ